MGIEMIDNTCVIYTNDSQECERVAALLKSLGGEYHEYKLDCHFSQRAFEAEFGKNAEYPQVAIGSKHIGSLKDTLHYCQEQGLLV
jgi:glutaredoxin